MLTAPVLVSAIPEFYNSTRLVFSSVHGLSDAGIAFDVRNHEYIAFYAGLYPTFDAFNAVFSSTVGINRARLVSPEDFSRAHISYFKDTNTYEILDYNPLNYDIQGLNDRQKRIYNVTVISSIGGVATSLLSNSLSALEPAIPVMYKKANRTAVTDWINVPLVGGRKRVYVATSGLDSNDGLTTNTAKLTVSAAYNILSAGDHILFRRGDTWTNQAFGGSSNGLPSNLCADGKSGSGVDCPTLVGPWGDESLPLPTFSVTNSAITTFFLADNDDQYAGLKNFYVKCIGFTASGRDVREEANGDDYPSFFTLLNTGGSAVAAGVSSADAHSDNILIEGCTLQEIGNAIIMNASYNSLIPGNDNKYNWGTSNFVSSYDASVGPACLTNILIRRNIFKDLYFLPAGSISRANTTNYINQIFNQYGGYANYHQRIQALMASFGKQPKAIYLYGTSGTANMVDGNIFYRCGNKAETYPETYDRQVATVHSEGGFNGIAVVRNLFYKCANIAVKQLDGGSNINNIYYRNPHGITMLGDVGLFVKKTYQGVPTSETFPSVSAGLPVVAKEGGFVPYWYFFDKNNALSIITKNIIEEPQDIGYNSFVISGEASLTTVTPTVLPKSTAIELLGGTVRVSQNYIGNISKGVSTGKQAVSIKGFEVNLDHYDRGASSITHPSAVQQYSNKISFNSNVINNHGSITVKNFANDIGRNSWWNNFEPSALVITDNTIRNAVWNQNAILDGANTLAQEAGENYLEVYNEAEQASTNRVLFLRNKIGFNAGKDRFGNSRQRGIRYLNSLTVPAVKFGEYSIDQVSGTLVSFFGTTDRAASVSSNTFTNPRSLQSAKGDGTTSWLESYLETAQNTTVAGRDTDGWTIVEPYFHNGDPFNVSSTRIWYVDPENGIDMFAVRGATPPTGWAKDTGASLGVTSIAGSSYEIGRHPEAPIKDFALAYAQLRHYYPDWILVKRGTKANFSARYPSRPFWLPTQAEYHVHGNWNDFNGANTPQAGLYWEKSGPLKTRRMVVGSYGAGAQSPINLENTGNWFGSLSQDRPQFVMYSNAANSGRTRYQDIHTFLTIENRTFGSTTPPFAPYATTPYATVHNLTMLSIEFKWENDPSYNEVFMTKNIYPKKGTISLNGAPAIPNYNVGFFGSKIQDILFEDIRINNTDSGISMIGAVGYAPLIGGVQNLRSVNRRFIATVDPSYFATGIEIRRCQFDSLWSDYVDPNQLNKAMDCLYAECTSGMLIEDCTMDRVAVKEIYLSSTGRRDQETPIGSSRAHHVYFQPSVLRPTFRNNVFAKCVFDALQVRGGTNALHNLFLKMPKGITFNNFDSALGKPYLVKDNVMLNTYQVIQYPVGISGGQQGGGGFGSFNVGDVDVIDNIVFKTHNPSSLASNNDMDGGGRAVSFGGELTDGVNPDEMSSPRHVKFNGNIIYNWGGRHNLNPLQSTQYPTSTQMEVEFIPLAFQMIDYLSSLTMKNNHFIYTDVNGLHKPVNNSQIRILPYNIGSMRFNPINTTKYPSIPYNGMGLFASGLAPATFDVGNNKFTLSSVDGFQYPQIDTIQEVLGRMNDNTSIFGNAIDHYYPNPFRSILTYVRDVDGFAPSFPNSRDGEVLAQEYFITKALTNRKGAWNPQWTSLAVVNYIREGFGKAPVNASFENPDQFFTSAIQNLACNNSAINFKFYPQSITNTQLPSLTSVTVSHPVNLGGGEIILPPVTPQASFNTGFINSLEGPTPVQSDEDATVTIKNTLAQSITVYTLDATGEEKQITIMPRRSFSTSKSLVTEALEDVVRRYKLPVQTDDLGAVERTIGSIPAPKVTTVAEIRNDIGTLREQLTNIIENAGINKTVDELVYGETKDSFYSEKAAAQTAQGSVISNLLTVGFPVILNRRNTLLVAGDFLKYAQSVIKDEYKILSLGTDETPPYLLEKYRARLALMQLDRQEYYDSVFTTKVKTVDQVYFQLGLSFTEPSEQDASE